MKNYKNQIKGGYFQGSVDEEIKFKTVKEFRLLISAEKNNKDVDVRAIYHMSRIEKDPKYVM